MTPSNLLLRTLARVFATSCKVERSSFKKIAHRIDETSGEQIVTIEYRFKSYKATPVSPTKKSRDLNQRPAERRILDTIKRDVQLNMNGMRRK